MLCSALRRASRRGRLARTRPPECALNAFSTKCARRNAVLKMLLGRRQATGQIAEDGFEEAYPEAARGVILFGGLPDRFFTERCAIYCCLLWIACV